MDHVLDDRSAMTTPLPSKTCCRVLHASGTKAQAGYDAAASFDRHAQEQYEHNGHNNKTENGSPHNPELRIVLLKVIAVPETALAAFMIQVVRIY
jgi:hypothetical protein